MIIKCTCKHKYQDERYGVGLRVHTPCADGTQRCTVCSRRHDSSGNDVLGKQK